MRLLSFLTLLTVFSCAGAQPPAYRDKTLNRIDSLLTPNPRITAAQVREAFYTLVEYSDSLHHSQPPAVVASGPVEGEGFEDWEEYILVVGFFLFVCKLARNALIFKPRKEL